MRTTGWQHWPRNINLHSLRLSGEVGVLTFTGGITGDESLCSDFTGASLQNKIITVVVGVLAQLLLHEVTLGTFWEIRQENKIKNGKNYYYYFTFINKYLFKQQLQFIVGFFCINFLH